ncbi:MAG: terpene cyclase/mutase family protein [Firmicutes bacterium]|nr:terpene cyclase/mutase family protein [Bacillota bacterium]
MKRFLNTTICLLLSLSFCLNIFAKEYEISEIKDSIEGIINWKKLDNGSTPDGYLINNVFLEQAGTTPGDWFPIGLGRYGYPDDYSAYLAVIREVVQERYKTPGKLHAAKSTEWHRISLAILAMGGNPTNVGVDQSGKPINLIADGSYDRGKTASLGRQGINGWIWGLIMLDSMRYPIPDGAFYTRDDIIVEILRQQLPDGGFALSGNQSDPDISAMALQALAPYYNNETAYTYTLAKTKTEVTKTVRQVADETLLILSKLQLDSGDFHSWGTANVESAAQVMVALCSLGINPQTDSRFIKNKNTLLDGIMKYKMPDGGFAHSFTYDENNPTSLPNQSNNMATEQVLYTLVAYTRFKENKRILYDFRPEIPGDLRGKINALISKINKINGNENALMAEYQSIPDSEKSYVYNYYKLSNAVKIAQGGSVPKIKEPVLVPIQKSESVKIDADQIYSTGEEKGNYTTKIPETLQKSESEGAADSEAQAETVENIVFTQADVEGVNKLPAALTTEYYTEVLSLIYKLENSEDFDKKSEFLERLYSAKGEIASIRTEIDNINADVIEQLYPFDKITLWDKGKVDSIVARYNKLSDYDKQKILRVDDILKTKTQVDNLLRAIIIWSLVVLLIITLSLIVSIRIKKRRKQKMFDKMQLDEAFYEDILK